MDEGNRNSHQPVRVRCFDSSAHDSSEGGERLAAANGEASDQLGGSEGRLRSDMKPRPPAPLLLPIHPGESWGRDLTDRHEENLLTEASAN